MEEKAWAAIVGCDPTYDGKFFYGVVTTGIFCRPSCKSKTPKKEHVRLFHSADEAVAAGFRPCKRCRPDRQARPEEEWIGEAIRFIDAHYTEPLPLRRLAALLHMSPCHLQRTFKRFAGCTPAEYIRKLRLDAAAKLLRTTNRPISDIAGRVGFASAASFSTVFQKQYGMPPSEYRKRHARLSDHTLPHSAPGG